MLAKTASICPADASGEICICKLNCIEGTRPRLSGCSTFGFLVFGALTVSLIAGFVVRLTGPFAGESERPELNLDRPFWFRRRHDDSFQTDM